MEIIGFIIIFIFIFIVALVICEKNERAYEFFEKHKDIFEYGCKLASIFMTVFIALSANSIAQTQAKIQKDETAPLFTLAKSNAYEDENISEAYVLSNKKGIASYVTLYKIHRYQFTSESYRFAIDLFIDENRCINYENIENSEWRYVPIEQNIKDQKLSDVLKEYCKKSTNRDIYVQEEELFVVDFADYKNEKHTYYFTLDGTRGNVKLAYTDENFRNNYNTDGDSRSWGTSVSKESSAEEALKRIFDDMSKRYTELSYMEKEANE